MQIGGKIKTADFSSETCYHACNFLSLRANRNRLTRALFRLTQKIFILTERLE